MFGYKRSSATSKAFKTTLSVVIVATLAAQSVTALFPLLAVGAKFAVKAGAKAALKAGAKAAAKKAAKAAAKRGAKKLAQTAGRKIAQKAGRKVAQKAGRKVMQKGRSKLMNKVKQQGRKMLKQKSKGEEGGEEEPAQDDGEGVPAEAAPAPVQAPIQQQQQQFGLPQHPQFGVPPQQTQGSFGAPAGYQGQPQPFPTLPGVPAPGAFPSPLAGFAFGGGLPPQQFGGHAPFNLALSGVSPFAAAGGAFPFVAPGVFNPQLAANAPMSVGGQCYCPCGSKSAYNYQPPAQPQQSCPMSRPRRRVARRARRRPAIRLINLGDAESVNAAMEAAGVQLPMSIVNQVRGIDAY